MKQKRTVGTVLLLCWMTYVVAYLCRVNLSTVLDKLADVAEQKRSARFVSVIAIAFPDAPQRDFTVRGECEGRILTAFAGDGGFGYDPLFYYPPLQKTFAQLTQSEKNQISHRARAMERFGTLLREKFGGGGNAVIKQ